MKNSFMHQIFQLSIEYCFMINNNFKKFKKRDKRKLPFKNYSTVSDKPTILQYMMVNVNSDWSKCHNSSFIFSIEDVNIYKVHDLLSFITHDSRLRVFCILQHEGDHNMKQ